MEKNNELTRCFIALDLPRLIIKEIEKVQKVIKEKTLFDGKLTDGESLHLTLKFLGEIDSEKIIEVRKRLNKIKFNQFEVCLGNSGVFYSQYTHQIKVLWLELFGKGIKELQKKVDEILKELFIPEQKFMPHITIARIRRVYNPKGFLEYIKKLNTPKLKFKVDKFYFKKSELFEEGPIYEDIEEYSLRKI